MERREFSFQILQERLFVATSLSRFRSQPVGSFRSELKYVLKELFAKFHDTREISNIDQSLQQPSINIPWTELCQFYDSSDTDRANVVHKSDIDKSTTPFQELIILLLDPVVVPRAYVHHVARILLEALLESPRRRRIISIAKEAEPTTTMTRWTPSQILILASFGNLWRFCPSLIHSFSAILRSLLHSRRHRTSHKWNRLLSCLSYLANDYPISHSTMLSSILEMSSKLDALIIQTKSCRNIVSSNDNFPQNPCARCSSWEEFPPVHQRRTKRLATLEDLHERDIGSSNYRVQYLPSRTAGSTNVSLKKILSAKTTFPQNNELYCSLCCQNSGNHIECIENLSKNWTVLRMRCLKKFEVFFRKLPVGRSSIAMTVGRRSDDRSFGLRHLLQMAYEAHESPSIRLCLRIACFDKLSSIPASNLCYIAWCEYQRTMDSIWLRLYCEMVVTWSCFDERSACLQVIEPIVKHLRISMNMNKDLCAENLITHRPIFQCFAHILSRRGCLVMEEIDSSQKQFQALLKMLEVHCGESEVWFSPEQGPLFQNEISTLQRYNVLGLTSSHISKEVLLQAEDQASCRRTEKQEITRLSRDHFSDYVFQEWPFAPQFCVRTMYESLEPENIHRFSEMITAKDFDERIHDRIKINDGIRKRSSACFTDYIHHEDLLLQILQYSTYQDITRYRNVCKSWQSIIDGSKSLWQNVYMSHFRIHQSDPASDVGNGPKEFTPDWRELFQVKLINEKNLLHRRHLRTGYKYCTCPFIGCYHVLKSERMERTHIATHLRKKSRKRSSISDARKKKEKKVNLNRKIVKDKRQKVNP